jgi:hypothetical protein
LSWKARKSRGIKRHGSIRTRDRSCDHLSIMDCTLTPRAYTGLSIGGTLLAIQECTHSPKGFTIFHESENGLPDSTKISKSIHIVVDLRTLLAAPREVYGYQNAKLSPKQRCVHREWMTQRFSVESTLYLESILHSDRHKWEEYGEDESRSSLIP